MLGELQKRDRAFNIDPPRHLRPSCGGLCSYREENLGPGNDAVESLTPDPQLENSIGQEKTLHGLMGLCCHANFYPGSGASSEGRLSQSKPTQNAHPNHSCTAGLLSEPALIAYGLVVAPHARGSRDATLDRILRIIVAWGRRVSRRHQTVDELFVFRIEAIR